jgi:hypothetical protein
MSKFWIMGGAAIAVSVAAIGWNCRPAHSSNPLLGKAQSEFAIRARDALIQRRMAQISVTSEVAMAPLVPATAPVVPVIPDTLAVASEASLAPERTYVVASLEPVAPPANSLAKTPDPAVAPQSPAADAVKASIPEPLAAPAQPEVAATEEKPVVNIEAETPVEAKVEAPIEIKTAPAVEAPVAETQLVAAVTPAPKALAAETRETPTVAPTVTAIPAPVLAPNQERLAVQSQLQRETGADETTRTTKPAAVASTSAPVQTATQASAPVVAAAPQPTVKVVRKAARAPCPSRVNTADRGYGAPREGYQSRIHREYGISRETIRSGMSTLRARDPQLAAMIARYM